MKNLKIKVCGMRNPENIDEVCASSPDFLGYIFYPKSKRYVGDQPDVSIFNRVPQSIQKAGVFVNEELKTVINLCKRYGLEIAQLHGNESPEYCKEVQKNGLLVFKAFSLDDKFDFIKLKNYTSSVDYFLFDTKGKLPGGTGEKFNWQILDRYLLNVPFFLSGGIAPNDADAIKKIDHPQLFALDINSGFELQPALKDSPAVTNFVKQIKN